MDLTNLENALNNSNFKENQLNLLKNFSEHDLEIVGKIQAIKNALAGYETSFLNNASFRDLTTQSIPTTYKNDWVFYKHSQAIVYEVLE
ncbi:hypothetical protein [Helicobacter pylori]|uniref:hypothetical protein n=1 Tax=Helicobacter pylori TaxID=210 RepID=UPI0012B2A9DC|nr:hypothetical protein [Helicobacter pylori]